MNTNDYSGKNQTGINATNLTFVPGGVLNGAISISGAAGGFINVPYNDLLNPQELTVSFWIQHYEFNDRFDHVISRYNGGSQDWVLDYLQSGSIRITGDSSSGSWGTNGYDIATNDSGHFVNVIGTITALGIGSGRVNLFVSGNLVQTATIPGIYSGNTVVPLRIGSAAGFSGNYPKCNIAEVCLWNRILSSGEISKVSQATGGLGRVRVNDNIRSGLVIYHQYNTDYNNYSDYSNFASGVAGSLVSIIPGGTTTDSYGGVVQLQSGVVSAVAPTSLSSGEITVAALVQIPSNQNWWDILSNGWSVQGDWDLFINSLGTVTFGIRTSGAQQKAVTSSGSIISGQVNFVAGSYEKTNSGTLMVYLNGLPAATPVYWSGEGLSTTKTVQIGDGFPPGSGSFTINQPRVFQRVCLSSEILTMYSGTMVGRTRRNNLITSGLIAHWPLNDYNIRSGTIIVDTVGNQSGQVFGIMQSVQNFADGAVYGSGGATRIVCQSGLHLSSGWTIGGWVMRTYNSGQNSYNLFNNNQVFIRTEPKGEAAPDTYEVFVRLQSGNTLEPRAKSNFTSRLFENDWVASKWDGTTLEIWVNGQQRGTSNRPGAISDSGIQTVLGAGEQAGLTNTPWYGLQSDWVAYERPLTSGEMYSWYLSEMIGRQNPFSSQESGLVLYLPLNGNTNDLSPYNQTATLTSGIYISGILGTMLELPGNNINRYVIISGTVAMPSTQLTAEMWVKTTGTAVFPLSYALAGAGNDNELLIGTMNSLDVYIHGNLISTTVNYADNQNHLLDVTWDNSNGMLNVWKDGILSHSGASSTLSGITIRSSGYLVLGQEQDSQGGAFASGQAYVGIFGGVKLYDRVITSGEIFAHSRSVPPSR